MRTKIIAFATLLMMVVAIFGCGKGNTGSPVSQCETNKTAEIRFVNNSTNSYGIYIDGTYYGALQGNAFDDLTVNEGKRTFEAVQETGYILYPTEKEYTTTVVRCQDLTWNFP